MTFWHRNPAGRSPDNRNIVRAKKTHRGYQINEGGYPEKPHGGINCALAKRRRAASARVWPRPVERSGGCAHDCSRLLDTSQVGQ